MWTIGSDMKCVKMGSCEHGKLNDTEINERIDGVVTREGEKARSLATSIGNLDEIDATVDEATGNKEDKGGRGINSEGVEIWKECSEDGRGI